MPVSVTESEDVVAGRHVEVGGGVLVDEGVVEADGEFASARHGVARVDDEVHEDLLDLARVGSDLAQVRVHDDGEFDVFADGAVEEALDFAERGGEVDYLGGDHLAAAEGEQLVGEFGGALAGGLNVGDLLAQGVGGGHEGQQEIAVAEDDGEGVIEVVGDAAGQAADGLHLLGLAELFFQAFVALDEAFNLMDEFFGDQGGGVLPG